MRSMTFHAVKNQVDTGLSLALDNRSYTMALNQFADWTQVRLDRVCGVDGCSCMREALRHV